jgi:4-aminobutyrate aminotransferase-like enzyme/Ser/Thr protein kinase RdoA (MazF antagonist)
MVTRTAGELALSWAAPLVNADIAARILKENWGLEGHITELPSERDRNFRVQTEAGESYVLKVANHTEPESVLRLQHAALARMAARDRALLLPGLVAARDGSDLARLTLEGGTAHWMRLMTWVPGVPLALVRPRTPEQCQSLGALLGRMDAALANWDHDAAHRALKWDLARASWTLPHFSRIESLHRRSLAERFFQLYLEHAWPLWDHLPASIIHNDANDHNVLVAEKPGYSRPVVAVIDFGDMVYTATVAELAIACAYAMLDSNDPLAAAAFVVRGYNASRPLNNDELHVLYPLICARLVVSAVNAALQRHASPENAYLQVSEAPVWSLLERLEPVNPRFALYRFRDATGQPAHPDQPRMNRWIEENQARFTPLIETDTSLPRVDLSLSSPIIDDLRMVTSEPALTSRIRAGLEAAGAPVGVGEYGEVRVLYTADAFRVDGWHGPERRTVHLGLALFAAPGTAVRAPLPGRVHSMRDNSNALDYGPTVILEHTISDSAGQLTFFTLYGHLDTQTLRQRCTGDAVGAGDVIGRVGTPDVNGGWSPHLHFQIVLDLLGRTGEFPGVARPGERSVWCSLSPEPYTLSGMRYSASVPVADTPSLLAKRHERLGANLSVAYRRPIHMVRGWMQHLFDADGRKYLDAVNNVPHVGHSHPGVVQTARQQMAVLNTNTRYLHETVLEYADRLCATLPPALRVCFFVNSGSEANELALRLARTHTRRQGIIVIDGAYHGNTTTLVDISPYKCDGPGGNGLARWARKIPMPDEYRGLYRAADADAGERYASYAETAIEELRASGTPVAAFVAESLLSCGGQIVLPPGYLKAVYRRVRSAGGVAIADEVQVGFGRVGTHFWGFETQDVVPDIVVMGKPAGNGHPLGIVVTSPEIAASFANGMEYFSTFGGNPVSCAIGLAVLDVLADEQLQSNAHAVGTHLLRGLKELVQRHQAAGDARGLGLFLGMELVRDRTTRTPFAEGASYLANRLRDLGILLSTDGPDHNVIKIKPPLCFTREDADHLITAMDQILTEDALSLA